MKFQILFFCIFFSFSALAQKELLQSGPMLGYSEMREVLLWAQTKEAADVHFVYWPKGKKAEQKITPVIQTSSDQAFVAKIIADEVEPSLTYEYQLYINGKPLTFDYPTTFKTQPLFQWRSDAPDFKMAIGSCTYVNEPKYDRPGTPYGGDYQIFTSINQQQPDAMLWLGDNIYLREVDWFTRTGIHHRYTDARSLPEMQPLLAATHHYAIWDDHDFGPNDSDRSFIHKDLTLEAFKLFWGNPSYGLPNSKGITTFFQFHDIDFFLLDNRYHRSPNKRKTGERTILGKEQLEWLIDALAYSQSPFKMVAIGGQVLNTAPVYENYANHHKEERDYLLKRIEEEGIKGVIFLSGDRHHTELSKYTNDAGIDLYDVTISPLTSGSGRSADEPNTNRVEGTFLGQRNFGTLEFSGPRGERKLTIRTFDSNGKELWMREIMQPKRD